MFVCAFSGVLIKNTAKTTIIALMPSPQPIFPVSSYWKQCDWVPVSAVPSEKHSIALGHQGLKQGQKWACWWSHCGHNVTSRRVPCQAPVHNTARRSRLLLLKQRVQHTYSGVTTRWPLNTHTLSFSLFHFFLILELLLFFLLFNITLVKRRQNWFNAITLSLYCFLNPNA
jgi:hypothetical protein